MARSVETWIGATDDTAIPPRVRKRVWEKDGKACKGCTRPLPFRDIETDHVVAIINGGKNQEDNLQTLCSWCHRAKTGEDVEQKSRVHKVSTRHLGMRRRKSPIRGWRKFDGTLVMNPKAQRRSRERSLSWSTGASGWKR